MSDESRTTPLGLLNYGKSFVMAARQLGSDRSWQNRRHGGVSFDGPLVFCLGQALELLFKAHFRLQGETLREIAKRSHKLVELLSDALETGLEIEVDARTSGDVAIIAEWHGAPYMSRYIIVGSASLPGADDRVGPSFDRLYRLADQLYNTLYDPCYRASSI